MTLWLTLHVTESEDQLILILFCLTLTVSTVLLRPLTSLLEVHISETYQTYAC